MLAAGAALATLPLAARAQTLTVINAGGVPEDGMTPALYAQEAGILRAHGLDVHFDAQRSGSATTAAVIGGAYALGKASVMSLINAHAHNVPIVLIFPGGVYKVGSTHSGMVIRADSPIKTGADLNGKLVAVSALNDLYTIGSYAWVDAHGGDWTSLKLLEIPITAIAEAVGSGRVDVGNLTDPFFTSALETKKVRLLADTDAAIASQFALTAWFSTRDYAQSNPGIVRAFRAALHEAAIYANDHHAATVNALAKFSGQDPGVVARMNRMAYGTELDPKLIQPLIDDAAKFKVIPAAFDARDFIATS